MDLFELWKTLWFKPGEAITAESVKQKYREKGTELHPDRAKESERGEAQKAFQAVAAAAEELATVLTHTKKSYTMPGGKLHWQQHSDWLGEWSAAQTAEKERKGRARMEKMSEEDRRALEEAEAAKKKAADAYARQNWSRRSGWYNGTNWSSTGSTNWQQTNWKKENGYTGTWQGWTSSNGHANGQRKQSEAERKYQEQKRREREFQAATEELNRKREQAKNAKWFEEQRRAQEAVEDLEWILEDLLFERDYFNGSHGGWWSVSEDEAKRRWWTFFESRKRSREYMYQKKNESREQKARYKKKDERARKKAAETVFGEAAEGYQENMAQWEEVAEKIRQAYEFRRNNPNAADDEDRRNSFDAAKEKVRTEREFAEQMKTAWMSEEQKTAEMREDRLRNIQKVWLFFMLVLLATVVRKNRDILWFWKSEKEYLRLELEQIRKDSMNQVLETLRLQEEAKKAEEVRVNNQYVWALDTIRGYIVAINRVDNTVFSRIDGSNSNAAFHPYGEFQSWGAISFQSPSWDRFDCSFALHRKEIVDVDNLIMADETHSERAFIFVVNNRSTVVLHIEGKKVYFLDWPQVSLKDLKRIIKWLEGVYASVTANKSQ